MLASLLAALALTATPGAKQTTDPQVAGPQQPTQLEDVTVTGRTLEQLIHRFVGEVAEPNRQRGLARWDQGVCVGIANLRGEAGQYIVDRVSTVAGDLGLTTGAPGCTPNLLIVATHDGNATASQLVAESPRAFRMGGAGMDRGGVALRDFQETSRPIRWWQLAMPFDSDSGQRATRLPGDCSPPLCTGRGDTSVFGYAPVISVHAASRLNSQIVDNIFRAVVIVDVTQVGDLSAQQIADYIAMTSLAQVDPDADTAAYSSILNLFEERDSVQHLTDWDMAYLRGLYAAERNDLNRRANRTEIEGAIRREHGRLRAGDSETTGN